MYTHSLNLTEKQKQSKHILYKNMYIIINNCFLKCCYNAKQKIGNDIIKIHDRENLCVLLSTFK